MPNKEYLEKKAAITARNLSHIEDILKNSGKHFDEPIKDVAKGLYKGNGSGSMFYDMAAGIPKKILRFGGTKELVKNKKGIEKLRRVNTIGDRLTGRISRVFDKPQQILMNADIKAGNFLKDKLKTNKFDYAQQFKTMSKQDIPQEILEINVPRLTAPVNRAEEAVLPLVGSFTIASQMGKIHENKKQKQGGDAVNENKLASRRNELIDKIAEYVDNNIQKDKQEKLSEDNLQSDFIKLSQLANESIDMLKTASITIKAKKEEINKLACENQQLKLQLMAKTRSERAVKLANQMVEKGIIKKAGTESKIDEIMELNDDAYNVLNRTVSEMKITKEASDGINSIDFVGFTPDGGEKQPDKKSFGETIIEIGSKI